MSWGGLIAVRAGREVLGSSTTIVGVDGTQPAERGLGVAALRTVETEQQTEQLCVSTALRCPVRSFRH